MSVPADLGYASWTRLVRRIRYLSSRALGRRLQKSQMVRFVTINEHRFKRVILRDTRLADRIEGTLEAYGPSRHFPAVVGAYEHEVWVEWIDGRQPGRVDDGLREQIADFYAELYSRAAREEPTADSVRLRRVRRDLRFLHQVAVLDATLHAELHAAAERLLPSSLWVGFDYTDPVLKNFVLAADDGRLCAVDVESLEENCPLGTGLAKATLRWLEPFKDEFLAMLRQRGAPDLSESMPFVDLAFLAWYAKQSFLEKKWRNIDVGRFRTYCR